MNTQAGDRKAAFTLVELLAVVAIIGLLIAILVPSVNAVRTAAKKTATSATLSTLSTGLETFRTQRELGEAYPPSASDMLSGSNLTYEVASPYTKLTGHPGGNQFEISGAGLLYWALVGADALGTPGFRALPQDSSDKTQWGEYTSDDDEDESLYYLNTDGQPKQKRYGPFVDLGTVKASQWDSKENRYAIPAEELQRAGESFDRNYPMFLDGFGAPVLYWRADRAGTAVADETPLSGPERGRYHFRDNAPLLSDDFDSPGQHDVLVLAADPHEDHGAGERHDLNLDVSKVRNQKVDQLRDSTDLDLSFARHILDLNVTARPNAQNADKYLLLSAGADLTFGTRDDISNFAPNGGLAGE